MAKLDRVAPPRPPTGDEPPGSSWRPASVLDVVPRLRMPTGEFFERPEHLAPYCRVLDRAVLEGGARAVVAAPNQHGKSWCSLGALLFMHLHRPGTTNMFVSFGQSRSDQAKRDLCGAAEDLGIRVESTSEVVTLDGSTLIRFTSHTGSVTGFEVSGLLLCDDLTKDDAKAHSASEREKLWRWFNRTAMSRAVGASADGKRPGTSVVVVATRQHVADLSGRLIQSGAWEYLRIPGICDDEATDPLGRKLGEPLWPSQRTLQQLLTQKANDPVSFETCTQGLPRTEGSRVFLDPHRCAPEDVPRIGRFVHGIDLSYSGKQSADWNVLASAVLDSQGRLFIFRVIRQKEQPEAFMVRAAEAVRSHPGRCVFRHATTETPACRELFRAGLTTLWPVPAKEEKLIFARTSGAVRAWNEGNVIVATGTRELDAFCDQVCEFTGVPGLDANDDDADVLGSLCFGAGFGESLAAAGGDAPFTKRLNGIHRGMHEPGRSLAADWLGSGGVLVDMRGQRGSGFGE